MAIADAIVLAADITAIVGESPTWSAREQALYWIDGQQRRVMRLRAETGDVEMRELPFRPSCLVLQPERGVLIGYKKGLGRFDFDTGEAQALPVPGVDLETVSFNDGTCDPAGRLWIGTRHRDASQPDGALYRVGTDLAITRIRGGLVVSNGIAFSPDGRTMYHIDSRLGRIDAYDFDVDTGTVSGLRVLRDYQGLGRRPDGCTVDAQGFLWVAEIDGARVARYAPDGTLDRTIALPVSKPSSVGFGGADLRTMFITTISYGVTGREAWAGKLLSVRVEVPGVPERAFGG